LPFCVIVWSSEQEFQGDLSDSWVSGLGDISEVTVQDVARRIVELRVVEDVEELRPEL
jgi:hypothetical protein